ncbi:gtp-binding protein rho5 [Anaeramoeba flamelloides]|uniref:Gtp-binding protein rho5 n=1 Tax=Anaeramoeba flamelloides TaxID=1746091 RepID=A0ABQ8Y0E9_9EUKA|nr:gtp-binding protein rho5 [Anaeramoeba flamelloides]
MRSIKCVVVGDGAVGKTCLIAVQTRGDFPGDYISLSHDLPEYSQQINNKTVTVHLWDTAGQEDYDRFRPLSYPQTNIFLICFSLIWSYSFENVVSKWVPEIKEHCPETPYILVGCKQDLLTDQQTLTRLEERGFHPIQEQQGRRLSEQIGALGYFSCSALTRQGVQALFDFTFQAGYGLVSALRNKSWLQKHFAVTIPKKPRPFAKPTIQQIKSKFKAQIKDLLIINQCEEQEEEEEMDFDQQISRFESSWEKTRFGDLKFVFKQEGKIKTQNISGLYSHKLILSYSSKLFFQIFQELKNKNSTKLNDLLELAGLTIVEQQNKKKKKLLCFLVQKNCHLFLELFKFIYFWDFQIFEKKDNYFKVSKREKIYLDQIYGLAQKFGIKHFEELYNFYTNIYHKVYKEDREIEKDQNIEKEKEKEKEKDQNNENEKETEKEKETENIEKEKEKEKSYLKYELKDGDYKLLYQIHQKHWLSFQSSLEFSRKHVDFIDFVVLVGNDQIESNKNKNKNKKNKKTLQPVGIPLNKFILTMKSNYFRHLFSGGYIEEQQQSVDLSQFPNLAMNHVLKYFYTEKIDKKMPLEELQYTLVVSNYLQCNQLQRDCEILLMNRTADLNIDDLVQTFLIARISNSEKLVEYYVWFMGKNYDMVSKHSSYKKKLSKKEKLMIKNKMWPPENYRKLQQNLKVKFAKKFGFLEIEKEKKN